MRSSGKRTFPLAAAAVLALMASPAGADATAQGEGRAEGQPTYNVLALGGRLRGDGAEGNRARVQFVQQMVYSARRGVLLLSDTHLAELRSYDPASGLVDVVAGTGNSLAAGNGGPATAAPFNGVTGVAEDARGNLYVSSAFANHVRRIDAQSGIVTHFAGSEMGQPGFAGDGGRAADALLRAPGGLAVDEGGNLYIADGLNNRIRIVDTTGTIRTFAGGGAGCPDATDSVGDGCLASLIVLNGPSALALDGRRHRLYVVDRGNHRLRAIDLATGLTSTLAGTGVAGYNGDDIPASAAELQQPSGVAVGSNGDVFIADTANQRVRRVRLDTDLIETVAGNGLACLHPMLRAAGCGYGGPATAASLFNPVDVALVGDDQLYVSNAQNLLVQRVELDASGRPGRISDIGRDGTIGSGPGNGVALQRASLSAPLDLDCDRRTGRCYIADSDVRCIRSVAHADPEATVELLAGDGRTAGGAASGPGPAPRPAIEVALQKVQAVAVGNEGQVFVADPRRRSVYVIEGSPATIRVLLGPERGIFPLALAVRGRSLFVASDPRPIGRDAIVWRFDLDAGTLERHAGSPGPPGYTGDGGPADAARLGVPYALAVDTDGSLYIADNANHVIRRVDEARLITTVAGDGFKDAEGRGRFNGDGKALATSLNFPTGVDARDGSVWILDSYDGLVRVLSGGRIATVAGVPELGVGAEAGPALSARFAGGLRVRIDPAGNPLVTDAFGEVWALTVAPRGFRIEPATLPDASQGRDVTALVQFEQTPGQTSGDVDPDTIRLYVLDERGESATDIRLHAQPGRSGKAGPQTLMVKFPRSEVEAASGTSGRTAVLYGRFRNGRLWSATAVLPSPGPGPAV